MELLRRRAARRTLQQFTEYTTPLWRPSKIHKAICEALDAALRKEIDRLLITCPPQHGKSSISSKRLPAFALGHAPRTDIISASATELLAEEFGRDTRNCIASAEYKTLFPATRLAEDSQAKGRWNTREGGGYYAVGIGGTIMGRGGELGLIDDPYKSWEDAQSQTTLNRVWDWYTGTFYNRIRPGGVIIVIQHRMHEDDLAGRLIAQQRAGGPDKWHIVELPADLDDPPWPERYDRAALERIKRVSGARKWSALYLQNPTPTDGTFFRREWFRRYTPEQLPKAMHRYLTSDHAPAGTEGNDYTCCRVWGLNGNDLYLLDGFRHQATMDVSMERVVGSRAEKKAGLIQKYKPLAWFPEDDNNWKAVAGFVQKSMLRESVFCRIEPISPNGADKEVKAQAIQAMASMGCVWIPAGPEGDDIIEQYVKFPGGKNDDEVDAGAVMGRAIAETHPAISKQPEKEGQKRDGYDQQKQEDSWRVS